MLLVFERTYSSRYTKQYVNDNKKLCLLGAQMNRAETKEFNSFQQGELHMILTFLLLV